MSLFQVDLFLNLKDCFVQKTNKGHLNNIPKIATGFSFGLKMSANKSSSSAGRRNRFTRFTLIHSDVRNILKNINSKIMTISKDQN